MRLHSLLSSPLFLYEAEHYLRGQQLSSHLITFHDFMEPKGLLLHSQKPSTGLYPEPDQSSPYHPILSLQDPS
jgi:hypothetical protein